MKENARTVAGVGGAGRPGQGRDKHNTGRPIDEVLARLDGVIQRGDEYRAFSPFQERRRTRTLAVREREDGAVLLHDFAGADTSDILAEVGLEVRDLYPPKPSTSSPISHDRWRPRISPREAFELASVEAWTVLRFGRQVVDGHEVSAQDYERCRNAVARLERLRAEVDR